MEKLIDNLKRNCYKYKFVEDKNTVVVMLGFGLRAKIKITNEITEINAFLMPWNFATGMIKINIKYLLLYNLIFMFIILGFLMKNETKAFTSPYYFDFLFVYLILSNLYYYIKYYCFKLLIQIWI